MPFTFTITHEDTNSRARTGSLDLGRGAFETPVFMPVGTRGTVKAMTQGELEEIGGRIRELLDILGSHPRRMEVMTEELRAVRAQIAAPRMTQIVDGIADVDDESLIEPGNMIVTLTRDGYVKRTSLDTFRAQHRGGRGRSAASTRQDGQAKSLGEWLRARVVELPAVLLPDVP